MDLSAHRLENMPKCRVIFEKYTESYPENYARKIIWAYKKLQVESDKPFYWSDIRALSGVKKHNFMEKVPVSYLIYFVALLGISILTVGVVTFQSWRAANENPVDML